MRGINLLKMLNLYHLSSLLRPIDFRYPSNVFAVVMSLVGLGVGLFLGLTDEKNTLEIIWLAVNTSLSVFVAWAITRELNPDHSFSAGIAAVLALIGMIIWHETTNLLALYLMLALSRGFVRTVGFPMRLLDLAGLGCGAGIITLTNAWQLGFIVAFALILDGILSPANSIAPLFGGLAMVATAVIAGLTQNWKFSPETSSLVGLAVISLIYLAVTLTASPLQSVGDVSRKPLDDTRLKTARLLVLVGGWLVYFAGGMPILLPLWCAFLAIGGFGVYRKFSS